MLAGTLDVDIVVGEDGDVVVDGFTSVSRRTFFRPSYSMGCTHWSIASLKSARQLGKRIWLQA